MASDPFSAFLPDMEAPQVTPDSGPTPMFLKNMLFEMGPGLIGYKPDNDLAIWRAANPTGALASSITGMFIPYLGWAGVAGKVPKLGKALATLGSAERLARSPVAGRAALETARFLPFEAARVAGSAVFGENTGDVFQEALLNTGLAAGFGAIGGVLSRGLTKGAIDPVVERVLRTFDPAFDSTKMPLQIQLRRANEVLTKLPAKETARTKEIVESYISKLTNDLIPNERTLKITTATGELRSRELGTLQGLHKPAAIYQNGQLVQQVGKGAPKPHKVAYELFRLRDRTTIANRRWSVGPGGAFQTPKQKELSETLLGLDTIPNYMQYMQFPRVIEHKTLKSSKDFLGLKMIGDTQVWKKMDRNTWMARENETGLFVMARRFGMEPKSKAFAGDRWLVFKTDAPDVFLPRAKMFASRAKAMFQASGIFTERMEDALLQGNSLWEAGKRFEQAAGPETTMRKWAGQTQAGRRIFESNLQKKIQRTITSSDQGRYAHDALDKAKGIVREYFAPTMFQFSGKPLQGQIWNYFRYMHDLARARAQSIFYGKAGQWSLRNVFSVRGVDVAPHGLEKRMREALYNQKNLNDFNEILTRSWSISQAKNYIRDIDPKLVRMLEVMNKIDGIQLKEMEQVAKVTQAYNHVARKNHYMVTRTWKGDFRVPIYDQQGRLVHVEAGNKQQAVLDKADALIAAVKEEKGQVLRRNDEVFIVRTKGDLLKFADELSSVGTKDKLVQDILETRVRMMRDQEFERKFLRQRKGVKGFFNEFTADDFINVTAKHIEETQLMMAEALSKYNYAKYLAVSEVDDPRVHDLLMKRIGDLYGVQTQGTMMINAYADRVLAPFLGGNSATKITRVVNSAMYTLTLGVGNIGFAILNAMTPIMTALPELAYLKNVATSNRMYRHMPLLGADLKPRGWVGVLDPLRIWMLSFKEMTKPGRELQHGLNKAMREGVIDPRMAEEFIHANARAIGTKEGWKNDFGKSLLKTLNWTSSTSEQMARGQTFTMGWMFARDILHIKDADQIYRVAKTFTESSMYLYSTADRARIITGPLGGMFGLFKNWMMHYIGNWMVYAGEGITRGNFGPLLYASLGAWSFGGLGGMGPTSQIVDGMSRIMGYRDTMEMVYEGFGDEKWMADSVMYGLPGLLGMSLTASAAAPGSEMMRDIGFFFNLAMWDRAKALGRAVGESVDTMVVSGDPAMVQDNSTRDKWFRALAPKTVYRAMQVFQDENIRSLNTGNPLVKDVSFAQRVLYTMGLTPVEVEQTFDLSAKIFADTKALRNQVTTLGKQYAEARRYGDWNEMQRIVGISQGLGITDRVMKSAATRERRDTQDLTTRNLDRNFVREVMEKRRLYGLE